MATYGAEREARSDDVWRLPEAGIRRMTPGERSHRALALERARRDAGA
ncbi:MAG: hypothetical protein JNL21_14615 [Myxococcales bacterium]|nr:hypothetical protein [Myxococcales bacterium]